MLRFASLALFVFCFPLYLCADEPAAEITPEQEKFFETKIRPVLARACYECHSAKKQQFSLRVDSRDFLVEGGDGGSALTPGKPEESRLWQVLLHDPDDTQMPPKGKLPDQELADIKLWIEMGAPWPKSDKPLEAAADAHADWQNHWAYQPISRPAIPDVQDAWALTSIDRFVLAKLQSAQVSPSPQVDKATLLRRLKFDLLGLPPSYEEVQQFAQNPTPQAWEAAVDRYLNSPDFGPRWARHWLDVARYADTKGYVFQEDRNYPDAYLYREWVINAFNNDLPYDQFVIRQIAGDQASQDAGDLHAMGFLTLGRRFLNNRHDIIDDRIDVVSRGLMGLTVTCARCHDHKYDPIPSADYYSLYGVFNSCDEPKNEPSTLRLVDKEKPAEPYVFLRGKPGNHGDKVPRQFLEVVQREERKPFEKGSGRLEMAQAIASAENPLTARVWANRVWGHLIGAGLVRTPSDFGVRADPPTHPELLDHLASGLIDNGWSTKKLIRAIVLSRVYQQRSEASPEIMMQDPENTLISHMNRRRRDFESLRDSMLSAAGRLDETVGGKSVQITERPYPTRRTVYAFIDRQNLPGLFRTFDFAGPDTHAPRRYETDVPQQALFLLNSPFVMEQAAHLTEPLAEESPQEKVRQLYRRILAREPSSAEIELAVNYLAAAPTTQEPLMETYWQYGYGEVDPEAGTLNSFTPLPRFTGQAWQGGDKLPDDKLGWATLNATGGHVGNDLKHAVIRRWTATSDGTVTIHGKLKHPAKEGDGVRGRILIGGQQQAGPWEIHKGETPTPVETFPIKTGETVDFVTDLKGNNSHDSFEWKVTVVFTAAENEQKRRFDADRQFRGPAPEPLKPWAQFAQVLLLSNEFQFVD